MVLVLAVLNAALVFAAPFFSKLGCASCPGHILTVAGVAASLMSAFQIRSNRCRNIKHVPNSGLVVLDVLTNSPSRHPLPWTDPYPLFLLEARFQVPQLSQSSRGVSVLWNCGIVAWKLGRMSGNSPGLGEGLAGLACPQRHVGLITLLGGSLEVDARSRGGKKAASPAKKSAAKSPAKKAAAKEESTPSGRTKRGSRSSSKSPKKLSTPKKSAAGRGRSASRTPTKKNATSRSPSMTPRRSSRRQ
ncbi:hypothetical protein PSACC_02285 [Paramicrosporidium saccamoebae]|uniref:Uncharacterized protein n=1 Tax=Paramicrosporidium saccamoebae TaxID=1246581 RepID=A0A2H9TJR5_9FUNG|nr:hypothetical protein PSACC_02285 [Paramicrosporidium saccamoebae]